MWGLLAHGGGGVRRNVRGLRKWPRQTEGQVQEEPPTLVSIKVSVHAHPGETVPQMYFLLKCDCEAWPV